MNWAEKLCRVRELAQREDIKEFVAIVHGPCRLERRPSGIPDEYSGFLKVADGACLGCRGEIAMAGHKDLKHLAQMMTTVGGGPEGAFAFGRDDECLYALLAKGGVGRIDRHGKMRRVSSSFDEFMDELVLGRRYGELRTGSQNAREWLRMLEDQGLVEKRERLRTRPS